MTSALRAITTRFAWVCFAISAPLSVGHLPQMRQWKLLMRMYGLDRRYTGVRVDGIRIDLLRIICQKIDLSNPLFEEKDIEDAIQLCRSKGYK